MGSRTRAKRVCNLARARVSIQLVSPASGEIVEAVGGFWNNIVVSIQLVSPASGE